MRQVTILKPKATIRMMLSLATTIVAVLLGGCAHTHQFSFEFRDATTREPVNFVSAYWTESWEIKAANKPFRQESGFLFSGATNRIVVAKLRSSVDNSFRIAAKGYEPVDLTYVGSDPLPSVGVFNLRKSPRPLVVFSATNNIILLPLQRQATAGVPGKPPK